MIRIMYESQIEIIENIHVIYCFVMVCCGPWNDLCTYYVLRLEYIKRACGYNTQSGLHTPLFPREIKLWK